MTVASIAARWCVRYFPLDVRHRTSFHAPFRFQTLRLVAARGDAAILRLPITSTSTPPTASASAPCALIAVAAFLCGLFSLARHGLMFGVDIPCCFGERFGFGKLDA